MATAAPTGDGLEFLADPVDRFPLPDLANANPKEIPESDPQLTDAADKFTSGCVREADLTLHLHISTAGADLSLSATDSQQTAATADSAIPHLICRTQTSTVSSEQSLELAIGNSCERLTLSSIDSHHTTEKHAPLVPPWTDRVHIGRASSERTPCPGRKSALEKTLRGNADKKSDTVVVPAIGNSFDSLGEACDYYNLLYSWEVGFGIRYGKSRLNVERAKCMQEIVCGCSGKPKKGNTRTCRCQCPAMIRLLRSRDNGWYISDHRPLHNHLLTDRCGEKVYWPSHKHIDVYTKDLVKQLREQHRKSIQYNWYPLSKLI